MQSKSEGVQPWIAVPDSPGPIRENLSGRQIAMKECILASVIVALVLHAWKNIGIVTMDLRSAYEKVIGLFHGPNWAKCF